jgi:hypothetical protein
MDRLAPDAVERLIKLLGMLGSAHDGERAAAGLKAHELVKRHGLTWADVLHPPDNDARNLGPAMGWHAQREFCLQRRARLSAKEQAFLRNLATWRGPLTERQQAWVDGIHARLREEAA